MGEAAADDGFADGDRGVVIKPPPLILLVMVCAFHLVCEQAERKGSYIVKRREQFFKCECLIFTITLFDLFISYLPKPVQSGGLYSTYALHF